MLRALRIGIYISASDSCYVLNNLISANAKGIAVHGVPRNGYKLIGNKVYNNILIGNNTADLILVNNKTDAFNNISDYNLFWNNGKFPKLSDGKNQSYNNLAEWKQNTGNDKHSLFMDPQFVKYTDEDYHLKTNSPCINNGKYVPFLNQDFEGALRIKNTPVIGPFTNN